MLHSRTFALHSCYVLKNVTLAFETLLHSVRKRNKNVYAVFSCIIAFSPCCYIVTLYLIYSSRYRGKLESAYADAPTSARSYTRVRAKVTKEKRGLIPSFFWLQAFAIFHDEPRFVDTTERPCQLPDLPFAEIVPIQFLR